MRGSWIALIKHYVKRSNACNQYPCLLRELDSMETVENIKLVARKEEYAFEEGANTAKACDRHYPRERKRQLDLLNLAVNRTMFVHTLRSLTNA